MNNQIHSTVEMTNKKYKAQIVISNSMFILGLLLLFYSLLNPSYIDQTNEIRFVLNLGLAVFGLLYRVVLGIFIWWNHG